MLLEQKQNLTTAFCPRIEAVQMPMQKCIFTHLHTFLTSVVEGVELSSLQPGIFNPFLLEWEAACVPESVGSL